MRISVIIATYNRASLLQQALDALAKQDFPKENFEVIVVNDGSTDRTHDLLQSLQSILPYKLHVLYQQNRGPAAARNAGINMAQGEIVAFTDDDCVPDSNWLSAVDRNMNNLRLAGLQGSTYTERNKITPLTHQIDNEKGNASVPTCNAAYRRELLLKVGQFDDQFPFPHNEDADLAWRIKKIGAVQFCADMRVFHPVRLDAFKKVASRMKILESEFRLYYKDKESYRAYRAPSPWHNIYWEIGVRTQFYYLKSRAKYWRKPGAMFAGIALTFLWWADLVRLLPTFLRANAYYKATATNP